MMLRRATAAGFAAVGLALMLAAPAGQEMSVQTEKAPVKERAAIFSKIITQLDYGTRVQVVGEQGGFFQIRSGATQGWMSKSALTEERIVFRSTGQQDTRATGEEVALAGKGFTPEVEQEYRKRHPNLENNFKWIDWMLAMLTPALKPEQMLAFLEQGKVTPGKGGGR